MKYLKIAGSALVVACVVSVMTVASAEAALFSATAMGKLTAKVETGATGVQKFTTAAGTIECKEIHLISGEAVLHSLTQVAKIEYTNCKAFGIVVAKITPAEYEFSADGLVRLIGELKVETEGFECTIGIRGDQDLLKVKYIHIPGVGTVIYSRKIHKLKSSGTGSGCSYAEEANGTAEGDMLVGLASGLGSYEWIAGA